jgi:hypothetical protein
MTHASAPELRVQHWIDADGNPSAPIKLHDLGEGFKVIYCFQHWCQGCHSHGFPTLRKLVDGLSDKGFGFAVVQTVFEGEAINTIERLRETQLRYALKLPLGHDPATEQGHSSIMTDYGTDGTPWFIVINPTGEVVFSDFHLDSDRLILAVAALSRTHGGEPGRR